MPEILLSSLMILSSAFFACFAYSRMGLVWEPKLPRAVCTVLVAIMYGALNFATVYYFNGAYMLLILQPLNILLVKTLFGTNTLVTVFCANIYVYIFELSKTIISSIADIAVGHHVHIFGKLANKNDMCVIFIFTYILASVLMYLFTMCSSKSSVQEAYKNSPARIATIKKFTMLLLAVYAIEVLSEMLPMNDRTMAFYYLSMSLLIAVSLLLMFIYFTAVDSIVENREAINTEFRKRRFAYFNGQAKYLDEFRKFRHDYKNRMTGLSALLDTGDVDRAKEYLKDVSEKFDVMREHTKNYSDNTLIDAVLQNLYVRCLDSNISFESAVIVGDEIPLSDMDICTVFFNMADNAYDAASKSDEDGRYIRFETSRRAKWLIITAENSFNGMIVKNKDGVIETSKEDTISHGIGLKNIQSIVESVPGATVRIEPDTEEKIFRISLIFPRTTETEKATD